MPEKINLKERGQSMVEFAVSAVVLIILLVGIVDLSRAIYTYMGLRDAAEEGAIFGSMYPDQQDGIRQRVVDSSSLVRGLGISTEENMDILIDTIPDRCLGSRIRVWVEYPNFELTMPFLGALIGTQTIPIRASVWATIIYPSSSCP